MFALQLMQFDPDLGAQPYHSFSFAQVISLKLLSPSDQLAGKRLSLKGFDLILIRHILRPRLLYVLIVLTIRRLHPN